MNRETVERLYSPSYYANIRSLLRFLQRKGESGYVFAVAKDGAIIKEVNDTLRYRLKQKNVEPVLVCIDYTSDIPLLQQFRDRAAQGDVLIVENLDQLFNYQENGSLTDESFNRLISLNFGREAIHALHKPILFWLSEHNISTLANKGNDFFSQRRQATYYFTDVLEHEKQDAWIEQRFNMDYVSKEAHERISLQVELKEKQLEGARAQGALSKKHIREIVIPLAGLYSDLEWYDKAWQLVKTHEDQIGGEEPDLLLKLGTIARNCYKYEESIQYFAQAIIHLDEELRLDRSIAYSNLGDLHSIVGELSIAKEWYEKDLALSQSLADKYQHNKDIQDNLGTAIQRLGDLYEALSDFEQALQYYKAYKKQMEVLVSLAPTSNYFVNGLGVAYSRLGDTYLSLGQYDLALHYFEQEKALFEQLIEEEEEEYLKHNLAKTYAKLGDLFQQQGRYEQALAFLQKEKALIERVVAINPDFSQSQKELAFSYGKLGDLHYLLGHFSEAEQYQLQALELFERLANEYQEPEQIHFDLATSYDRLATVYLSMKDYEQAVLFYKKDLELTRQMLAEKPDSAMLQNSLAISYEKLGDVYRVQEQNDNALSYYIDRYKIAASLVEKNSAVLDYQIGLAISYEKLGEAYQALGQYDEARDAFLKESVLFQQLSDEHPESEQLRRGLAVSFSMLGHLEEVLEELDLAADYITKALEESRKLYQANRSRIQLTYDYIYYNTWLAKYYQHQGDQQACQKHLQKARELATLGIEHPTAAENFHELLEKINDIESGKHEPK
jgi:tetratricopeptide (TPR) repeat protein